MNCCFLSDQASITKVFAEPVIGKPPFELPYRKISHAFLKNIPSLNRQNHRASSQQKEIQHL